MKELKENYMEIFLLLVVFGLIVMLYLKRDMLQMDTYIQSMIQIAVISIFLMPQFINNAKKKLIVENQKISEE